MAWIELHQALKNHPKLLHLKALLVEAGALPAGLASSDLKDLVRAKLENLWLEALDYCLHGSLTVASRPLGAPEIADWSNWHGDPTVWLRCLIDSGWIDEKQGGLGGKTLYLHDWQDYAGKLLARREADRERKPKKGTFRNSVGIPQDAARTVPTEPTVTVPTNQPTEEEERGSHAPLASQDVAEEGREVDRTVAAFGFCISPGVTAKRKAISELRRLGVSHDFIRSIATMQEKKPFYTIMNEIEKGKAKPDFKAAPPAPKKCRNDKCINGRVADLENSTSQKTAWKPCPECGPPANAKATG